MSVYPSRLRLLRGIVIAAVYGGSFAFAPAQEAIPAAETQLLQDEKQQPALQPAQEETTSPQQRTEPEAQQDVPASSETAKPAETKTEAPKAETKSAETAKPAAAPEAAAQTPTLPADSITQHTLDLAGRTLRFEAVAGTIPLTNADGRVEARMAYVSYTLAGNDAKTRPVAFVFNGGPGSASAWLHLGALGPWRVPLEGDAMRPSAILAPVANAETWLDFTDLVLIDPIGTGYSTLERDAKGESKSRHDLEKQFWSVSGDIESIATFISKWLDKTGRHTSPKLLVGESYGGFRVPKVANSLLSDHGIGLNLLVMVSPVLDFGFMRGQRHLPFNTAALLPSLAAAAQEARGKVPTPGSMRESEDYARGPYFSDMLRGPRDQAAVDRIVTRVAALTGLPASVVKQYGGRLTSVAYRREANRGSGQLASAYDASITGLDPEPGSPGSRAHDPYLTALRAPLTNAMIDLYTNKLAWRPDAKYLLINGDVGGGWQYGNSPSAPESVSDLKAVLALDNRLRVLVTHGYTDLVTPYFASTLVLDQLPAYGDARRVAQITYPGGHMFYGRDGSRSAFREDALILLAASLSGEAQTR